MGTAGVIGSFFPHELLRWTGSPAVGSGPVIVQLAAALLFGFALLNWTARGSLLGGIYNRPVAIGNLTHFTMGALALSKHFAAGDRSTFIGASALVYLLFAIGFAAALFRSPVQPQHQRSTGPAAG
jgi:hypothetical protein